MSIIALTITSLLAATTDIWVESSLVNVYPDSGPTSLARKEIRLYAAAGERESFQICIEGGRKGYSIREVKGAPLAEGFPEPEIRRVGYLQVDRRSPRAHMKASAFPDPLLPMAPFEIPAKQTRALWVTYAIPRDAKPGLYKGQIEIVPEKGAKRRVAVEVEVFGFVLQETPTLRTSFPLDRRSIRNLYGIPDGDLDAWKPVYDALAPARISYSLWTDGDLVRVADDGTADTSVFKEHLEYVMGVSPMAAIDIGMGDRGIAAFPPLEEGAIQDPLQLYLFDINKWLDERGWLSRGFIQPMPPQEAEQRQEARAAYFRVWRADKRTDRLVAGALHPSLERYTDIWAVPLRYRDPFAQKRLQGGYSLIAEPEYPAVAIEASSAGGGGEYAFTDTTPEEAYDGSLFTSWVSANEPTDRHPEWLQIDLEEPVESDRMRIGWKPGLEPTEITVRTSADGRIFNKATTRWEHHTAAHPFDQSWSECRFRSTKFIRAIVLEFRGTAAGGPVGVTEIEFGDTPESANVERINPIQIWTYGLTGDFPGLYADADPLEARMVAWVCWGHRVEGFLHRRLNAWPREWSAYRLDPPLTWGGGGDGYDFLCYPGPDGPLPSVRLERLRDGIDDYDYMVLVQQAVEDGVKVPVDVQYWLQPRDYEPDMTPAALEGFGEKLARLRQSMGRALTEWAKETRE